MLQKLDLTETTLFQPTTATFKRYTTRPERLDRHLPRRRRASTSFLLRANIIRITALQFRQTARPPTRWPITSEGASPASEERPDFRTPAGLRRRSSCLPEPKSDLPDKIDEGNTGTVEEPAETAVSSTKADPSGGEVHPEVLRIILPTEVDVRRPTRRSGRSRRPESTRKFLLRISESISDVRIRFPAWRGPTEWWARNASEVKILFTCIHSGKIYGHN
jgi:hypothetical protein